MEAREKNYSGMKMNGFLALFVNLLVIPALAVLCVYLTNGSVAVIAPVVVLTLAFFIMLAGYFSQEPNEARVMVFFGKYEGTFKDTGFYWVNPFMEKKKFLRTSRHLSAETKAKISRSLTGRPKTLAHKEAIRQGEDSSCYHHRLAQRRGLCDQQQADHCFHRG